MSLQTSRDMMAKAMITGLHATEKALERRVSPWHLPQELPPANTLLLLSVPDSIYGDIFLGEHDGRRWMNNEGVFLDAPPALWCAVPTLPGRASES